MERGPVNHCSATRRGEELTVGQGNDLARPFGLRHSPDVLYRVGLALPSLTTEVVREIAILPDA